MNFRKTPVLLLILTSVLLTQAAAMNVARQSHTATLLPEGNILIAGGVTAAGTATNSVEMYNMATNLYENWGDFLDSARSSHTATLMSDGRVLIAGGFNAGTPLSSIEICNPITKACSAAGLPALSTPRGGHTATMLTKGPDAGKVLICGGQNAAAGTSITRTCDLFNPTGQTITAAAPMTYARMGHAATLLYSGKVFVTGGKLWTGSAWLYEPNTEIYTPKTAALPTDKWENGAALLQGRTDHTVTVLNNGTIMIAGGYNAFNRTNCITGEEEECWTEDDLEFWGYGSTNQDMGNHGNLDGAEYFNQEGGTTVMSDPTFGVAPYRVRQHSAALLPDGSWNMYGGYGNIVRTNYEATPNLETDAVFYLINGVVQPNSRINFQMTQKLARAVSGRLVDADAFFAKTADGGPAFEWAPAPGVTIKIFLDHSTSTLDGLPVGTLNVADNPGIFDNIVTLTNPTGGTIFSPGTFFSDSAEHPTLTVITSTLTFPVLYPANSASANSPAPFTGDVTAWIGLVLPNSYKGITGTAVIKTGGINDAALPATYTMSIKTAGTVNINFPVSYVPTPIDETTSLFVTSVSFPVTGEISNLSPGTTIFPLVDSAAGAYISLDGTMIYGASEVHPGIFRPAFNFSRSDIVIREMIFSSALGFSPRANSWKSLADIESSPTLVEPVFDQTTLVTPAADTVVLGGRNCETAPAADCDRTVKNFRSRAGGTVFIPAFKSQDGSSNWPTGEKLNSKRAFHTSTLLLTGHILTCGGSDGVRNLATCELMDPETKKWTATGSMNYPRKLHTATLLPNGTVLVTGGVTVGGASVKYAEIYYPDTQRWVATSPMAQVRQRHTATLLQDGNVLVAGGDNASSAELFISSNALWQNVGSMTSARAEHTATLLKSGNVLMAGGLNSGALRETEIYRFANRDFIPGPLLTVGRYGHTANLLRDGRVLVIGGSDNLFSSDTSEIYDGAAWGGYMLLNLSRAKHRSVLLPNGKVMVTGGKTPGTAQNWAESYDPDFSSWISQGKMSPREDHTSVLTTDNYIINIGGWDGSQNLDTTDIAYFSYSPDMDGLEAETTRQMIISTATSYFNHGMWATLLSSAANFHGVTEASGGGAGSRNSSFSNPRVYMSQIDNPSGFMIDLSTRIYSLYGGQNTNWETTLSSITIITPTLPGEMPHGWYTMRTASNGVFSKGVTVQVTIPRPQGAPSVPTGLVLGVSSITWSWTSGTIPANGADGYNIYASSNNVFVATTAFTANATYTQTGFRPNTEASLMVNSYNVGGTGPLSRSATYYTLAAPPTSLTVAGASFETAELAWSNNGNVDGTIYELSMYTCPVGDSLANCGLTSFTDTLNISTPVAFNVSHTSTFTETNQLSPNRGYFFRVRAVNGAGITTAFSNSVSTMTVGNINNLTGIATSSSTVSWSWDKSNGADGYEVYDVTTGTDSAVFVGSTTYNYFSQSGLLANRQYAVAVNAMKNTPVIKGPLSYSDHVYTLAVPPGLRTTSFNDVLTTSLTANWMTNGNSTWTVYQVQLSTSPAYPAADTVTLTTSTDKISFGGLSPNVRYYARVYSINGDEYPSAATNLGYKYTMARAPAAVTPSLISMSGVTLSWDQNGNSPETIYEVRYTTETFGVSSTTYVPFSAGFTGDSFAFPGLLTATTYYFQVAARNGEGNETAAIDAVPAAYTLPGPSSAPSGSIGGTSDPEKDVLISGVLPTGRNISLAVPSGSFPAATAIAISSSAQNPCNYKVAGIPIEVAVYSQNTIPQVPVTLTLSYTGAEAMAAIDTNRQSMVLARYNPVSGQCLALDTTINTGLRTINSTLNYFAMPGYNSSVFQLMLKTAATNLSNVLIYPNPFYTNRGNGYVTIDNIPAASSVRIYTLSGTKVWEGSARTTGMLIWKGLNKGGQQVASGVYLAVIDSPGGKKVLKLAVER